MRRIVPVIFAFVAACGGSTSSGVASGVADSGSADGGTTSPPPAGAGELLLATEIVGRPTASSVAINVVPKAALEAYVEVGTAPGTYDRQGQTATFAAGEPATLTVDGLTPNQRYGYRVRFRRPGDIEVQASVERHFRTQRAPGSTFAFTVQSDSHLDENSNLDLYRVTLANIAADDADFHVDLGDTFMCEKHSAPLTGVVAAAPDRATVDARYLYERGNFGLFAHSVPLFLVNGNHDGELGYLATPGGEDIATWATLARERYYLNPRPDAFYSGDSVAEPNVGERAAWYAWQWGDALFVALDPFWNSKTKASKDAWTWTLGKRQYDWLTQTLTTSTAKYKFVFLHNLVGGLDGQMRGGVEAAPFYEWGGKNEDGSDGFAAKRPGWAKPIHQLLVDAKVTAVFHGHDHLYAKQDLDGIVYQEVPQPSAKNTSSGPNLAKAYHYTAGTIVSSSGHLRLTVAPDHATVDYVRAWLPSSENTKQTNREIADTYTITPR